MVEFGRSQGEPYGKGNEAPRAEAAGFEPPRLTVIGTVQELTKGKPGAGSDGQFPMSFTL
jgi:hypothetical protein